jgi:2-enoate reductase
MEKELELKPAGKSKSVLVIGGGPGGMEAAMILASRGHKVTLWEKSSALGGNLIPATVPNFKGDYRNLINYLSMQLKKLGVKVQLNKKATAELVAQEKPDVVLVATGGEPCIPSIPGIEKEKVATAAELLLGEKKAGQKVIVIGGGLVGCEVALYLARKGKTVTIVEILDRILHDVFVINRMHLEKLIKEARVEILTGCNIQEITGEGISATLKSGGNSIIKANTIVIAAGYKANSEFLDELKAKMPEAYGIGDCVEADKVIGAIWKAYRIARLV